MNDHSTSFEHQLQYTSKSDSPTPRRLDNADFSTKKRRTIKIIYDHHRRGPWKTIPAPTASLRHDRSEEKSGRGVRFPLWATIRSPPTPRPRVASHFSFFGHGSGVPVTSARPS